jgi:hypothetical protein
MPRRPPPSSLLLVKGPTPSRAEPKHRLPSLPQPTFYPTSTIAGGRRRSEPNTSQHGRAKHQGVAVLVHSRRGSTAHEYDEGERGLAGRNSNHHRDEGMMMLPNTISIPSPTASQLSPRSAGSSSRDGKSSPRERLVIGPWDHSRNFKESQIDVNALLPEPAPAAVSRTSGTSTAVYRG